MIKILFRSLVCFGVSLLLALTVSPYATADQSGADNNIHTDGVKGENNIRTNASPPTGVGFAHPNQVNFDGDPDNSWLAVGTYKGSGTSGTAPCPNSYTTNWSVYIDYRLNGHYYCFREQSSVYAKGNIPPFQIVYSTGCGGTGSVGWGLSFGGTLWACINNTHPNAPAESGFIETTGSDGTPYNIDLKWRNMQIRYSSDGLWHDYLGSVFGRQDIYKSTVWPATGDPESFWAYDPPLD